MMTSTLPAAKKTWREFVAVAAACLFLIQALSFIYSSRAMFSHDSGIAIAAAGEFCSPERGDGGKAPAQRHHHDQNCVLCGGGNRAEALADVGLVATVIVLALLQPADAPTWFPRDALTPTPLGWTSSWASRAPPAFS